MRAVQILFFDDLQRVLTRVTLIWQNHDLSKSRPPNSEQIQYVWWHQPLVTRKDQHGIFYILFSNSTFLTRFLPFFFTTRRIQHSLFRVDCKPASSCAHDTAAPQCWAWGGATAPISEAATQPSEGLGSFEVTDWATVATSWAWYNTCARSLGACTMLLLYTSHCA